MAGLGWGIGELFTRQVLHGHKIGPVTAITLRTTFALPLLWVAYVLVVHVWKAEPDRWWESGAPTLLRLALGSGLLAGCLAMLCFYGALHLGPISTVKPIAFTIAPAVAVVLGWLVLGEPLSLRKVVAVILILGGVGLLTSGH
jgi:transporter family protein